MADCSLTAAAAIAMGRRYLYGVDHAQLEERFTQRELEGPQPAEYRIESRCCCFAQVPVKVATLLTQRPVSYTHLTLPTILRV